MDSWRQRMTNIERIKLTFANVKIGSRFKTKEIKDLVVKSFPNDKFSRDSILPSDHCYNLYNFGLKEGIKGQLIIFKQIDHGYYEYLGENADITCTIMHKPKNDKPYVIGRFVNGQREMYCFII